MSTRGDIGFIENNEKYLVYSHYDNFPDSVLPNLFMALSEKGYDWFVNEIKTKGLYGGLRFVDYDGIELGEWYNDIKKPPRATWKDILNNEIANDYSYIVHPDLSIDLYKSENFLKKIKTKDMITLIFTKFNFESI